MVLVLAYDLKSAFHLIWSLRSIESSRWFKATVDGMIRVLIFKAMSFGYRDASRILTKVMSTAICRWRKAGMPSFIHIDDGLELKSTKEESRVATDMVKKDLDELVDKCQWEPVQNFIW